MALRKEVASQAVGDLAGIDLVVLLLGRSDSPQHQRMRDLNLLWRAAADGHKSSR